MRVASHYVRLILLGAALVPGLSGCAVHARVYDSYHGDYHNWHTEDPYYRQWLTENHREYRDYDKLNADDQKQYWDWRHNQDQDHH